MSLARSPRVAVLVDTSTGWGRRLIRGINSYAQQFGPWHVWVEARGQEEILRLPPGWHGDGVIARVSTYSMARHLAEAGTRVVNISSIELKGVNFPCVTNDMQASSALAMQHFLDLGFRNFAYCGLPQRSYVANQYRTFAGALEKVGFKCHAFRAPGVVKRRQKWVTQQAALSAWLKELPKPVAILTWGVHVGRAVVVACGSAGLLVPEEVAVLCGDDDDLLCESCYPPMSGTVVAAKEIGYQAASLLAGLMKGASAPRQPVLVAPTGISMRQSTNTLAINDSEVSQAVRFIRDHCAQPIQVSDILKNVPVSRRTLERKFELFLGRTPASEIRRAHLQRARELLANTGASIQQVAESCGFGSPEYLSVAFRREFKTTPLKYRLKLRGTGAR